MAGEERLTTASTGASQSYRSDRQLRQEVVLTPAEQAGLRARARELGVSVPRLMVEAALSNDVEPASQRRAELVELFEIRRLLATVANNVNQLAHVANAELALPPAQRLDAVLGEVREVLGELRAATATRRRA